jgi:hypothetical protein
MGKKYLDTKENSIESAVMQVWQEAAKLNEFQKVNGQFKKVDGGDKRRTENKMKTETNKNDKSDDGEGLDAVQPKAVKKKFDARKDKDIDNDGDTDSSDEFLHKKRKAISKAMKKEVKKEGAMKRGKDLDTFKPKDTKEEFEQHQEFKVQSMRAALEKVWKGS